MILGFIVIMIEESMLIKICMGIRSIPTPHYSFRGTYGRHTPNKKDLRSLGQWVREQIPEQATILTNDRAAVFSLSFLQKNLMEFLTTHRLNIKNLPMCLINIKII